MTQDKEEKNPHAVALGRLGGKKGGKVRVENMTEEELSKAGKRAATARWKLPKATHTGELKIGKVALSCHVLDDERRVLSQRGMLEALGMSRSGGSAGAHRLGRFAGGKTLNPYVSDELAARTTNPIKFRFLRGGSAYGYEATVLAELCEAVLEAREANALLKQQRHIAKACEILMRGFARVGIVALVDEATGYQKDRDRDALHRILEEYISEELLPWTKRFPDAFYEEMFRLHEWSYSPLSIKRPILVGKLTNQLIYEKLPPGVLEELQRKNPKGEKGYRKHKFHQFLTAGIGNPHLEKQIASVVTLMRVSDSWDDFKNHFKKAFPKNRKKTVYEIVLDIMSKLKPKKALHISTIAEKLEGRSFNVTPTQITALMGRLEKTGSVKKAIVHDNTTGKRKVGFWKSVHVKKGK